ncbi:MotA/TolQ/ExbB proton channel family protein [Ectothiorhodospira shaposhnikovii]|nr:MotA/TolQ/ExbB proton channel family protein [Ectothiorhodospira shaposhnikovii]MCG5514424.1 MotA/TolQ/ExbB proton channel family protein [Ectothiorhodospira shaposhnikovii]
MSSPDAAEAGIAESGPAGQAPVESGLVDTGLGETGVTQADVADTTGIVHALQGMIDLGGPVVAILLIMSVVALTIILVKIGQFLWWRLGDERSLKTALEHWRDGRVEPALETLSRSRSPAARVMEVAIQGRRDNARPEPLVREEATRVAVNWLERLRGQFRMLEVIGTLAPLLGLLGTVLGMIAAFQQLEAAGNRVDPSILSGGIWVALLTTAVGLAVAIPVVAVLNGLERWVERFRHRMQDALTQVFTLPPPAAERQQEPTPIKSAQKAHIKVWKDRAAGDAH